MSRYVLPLTAGLLLGATAYQVIHTHVEENTIATRAAFRRMQKDIEVGLPVDQQHQVSDNFPTLTVDKVMPF